MPDPNSDQGNQAQDFDSGSGLPLPGDVINTRPDLHSTFWQLAHPFTVIPQKAIQAEQRLSGYADVSDTHSMLYFDSSHILSVTYPHTIWESWGAVRTRRWRIFRPVFTLDNSDVEVMCRAAALMIGTHYDIGQLLDIALNDILHYDVGTYHRFFDFGAKLKVCSVGVRTCFESARKAKEDAGLVPPFGVLFLRDGVKLNVERTPPAAFSNTPDRFSLIASCQTCPRPY